MSDAVYHDRIKDLARAATGAGRLAAPARVATVDNPLCGDKVRVELRLDGDLVAELGHEVRGCMLCQAAAAVLATHAPGHDAAALAAVRAELAAMLRDEGPAPAGEWADLGAFLPVRRHKSRHDCVLLPFTAAERALSEPG